MQDRTEITETTTPTTRVNGVPRTSTEVRTVEHGVGAVDRVESVAYDPYANKRIMAARVIQLVYLIFGLIEGLILIRFVLKALGANASAGFAQFIYGVTSTAGRAVLRAVRQPRGAGQRAGSAFHRRADRVRAAGVADCPTDLDSRRRDPLGGKDAFDGGRHAALTDRFEAFHNPFRHGRLSGAHSEQHRASNRRQ